MKSNLQNKLQQFRAEPPQGVWDRIADSLHHEAAYAQRLHAYEEQPPASSWQKIEEGLTEKSTPASVVPFSNRFRRPIRYAAVASIIAVALVTITLTFRRTRAGELEAGSHSTVTANEAIVTTTAPKQNTFVDRPEKQTASTEKNIFSAANNPAATEKAQDIFPSSSKKKKAIAASTRYLFYNDDDGNVVKVSKKLASLVNCKDGDIDCKQRLQELRQKLAANAMTTDFTGILEMLRQLQQKP